MLKFHLSARQAHVLQRLLTVPVFECHGITETALTRRNLVYRDKCTWAELCTIPTRKETKRAERFGVLRLTEEGRTVAELLTTQQEANNFDNELAHNRLALLTPSFAPPEAPPKYNVVLKPETLADFLLALLVPGADPRVTVYNYLSVNQEVVVRLSLAAQRTLTWSLDKKLTQLPEPRMRWQDALQELISIVT